VAPCTYTRVRVCMWRRARTCARAQSEGLALSVWWRQQAPDQTELGLGELGLGGWATGASHCLVEGEGGRAWLESLACAGREPPKRTLVQGESLLRDFLVQGESLL
jgi:hypothetical protein